MCPIRLNKKTDFVLSKILGLVRDALGGVGWSFLNKFEGFSKEFEKLKIKKIKFVTHQFQMHYKIVLNKLKYNLKSYKK